MATIDPARVKELLKKESELFAAKNGKSKELFEKAKDSLHNGVPMNWMVRWSSPYPLFVSHAKGQYFWDVDGHKYLDLCLGDTGAMTGHAMQPTVDAITAQVQKGLTYMLPTEDAIWVGQEMQRRFGLKYWQICMTATDANRFCIRLARHITGRKKVLTFNWCYHGTVDETFAVLDKDGKVVPRPGNTGAPVPPSETTKVVEFNDVEALEKALAEGDVAVVLAEPVMTNIGIVLPAPGFHDKLRELTTKYGTLLIIDETHCICYGIGGYTREHGLKPDFLTIGKPIAGGFPAGAYGFTEEVSKKMNAMIDVDTSDVGGVGGTLSANAVAMAAIKATLSHVLTEESFAKTIPLAIRFEDGVNAAINEFNLPWSIVRGGNRAEYIFRRERPRNGGEAAASMVGDLDKYMHLYALNRGILVTPFHAMALICADTTEADIDHHTEVFRSAVKELLNIA
jgi:glutamate-1-semialdehyde 2,1-aminomutase